MKKTFCNLCGTIIDENIDYKKQLKHNKNIKIETHIIPTYSSGMCSEIEDAVQIIINRQASFPVYLLIDIHDTDICCDCILKIEKVLRGVVW